MKKAVLILFAASLIFIFTGFGIAAVSGYDFSSLRSNSEKYPKLDTAVTDVKTASVKDCNAVELRLVNTHLKVNTATDGTDQIKLEYQNVYKNEWSYSFRSGVMHLDNQKYNTWSSSFMSFGDFLRNLREGKLNFHWNDDTDGEDTHTVTLTVPKGASLGLRLYDVNGNMEIKDTSVKSLSLNNVNCGFEADGLTVEDEIKVNAVNSPVEMKNAKAAKLTFTDVVNGQCSFASPQFEKISGNFVNGTLKLDGVNPDDYSISYSLVNGSVKAGENSYSGSGNTGSGAKYDINFKGVNSNLYLNATK